MKSVLPGTMVGPTVALDVVDVLVLEVEVKLVELVVEGLLVVVAELEVLEVVEVAELEVLVVLDVVDVLDVVEEVLDVDKMVLELEPASPFLYMFRRFGPPQYSLVFALQTMLH